MAKAEADIKRIVEDFVRHLPPSIRVQKVVLYGSHARGNPHEWSDIDIAVISDDFKGLPPFKRAEVLAMAHLKSDPALAPIAYTLEEYHNASHLTFLGEIKRTSIVIYEAQ